MRDLYATTMQLVHVGGGDAFEVASERALDWVWRVEGPKPDLGERPIGVAPEDAAPEDTSVNWWSAASETARALELRMRHPDSEDPTLQWQATITVSDIEGTTRVTLRLERGASVHVLRPWRIALRAPTVVLDFMRAPLRAYAGTLELSPGSRMLEAHEVPSFVENVLRAEGRALPILVAACDVDASLVVALVRALAGLVQVVRIRDAAAQQALRASLETRFEVPRGGLRLYWPGFGSPEQPRRHPYWTAAQIRVSAHRAAGRSSINRSSSWRQSPTGRVPADPGVLRARREALLAAAREQQERERANRERARRDRRRRQAAAAKATHDSKTGEQVDGLQERLAEAEDQLVTIESERDGAFEQARQAEARELHIIEESLELDARVGQLGSRVAQLEAENHNLRDNLKAITRYEAEKAEDEEPDDGVPNTSTPGRRSPSRCPNSTVRDSG